MPSAFLLCRGVGQLEYIGITTSEHLWAITNSSAVCVGRPNPMISSVSPSRRAGPILHYRQYLVREVLGQLKYIGSIAAELLWAIRGLSAASGVGHPHIISSIAFGRDGPTQCHRHWFFAGELANSNILALPRLSTWGPSRIHWQFVLAGQPHDIANFSVEGGWANATLLPTPL